MTLSIFEIQTKFERLTALRSIGMKLFMQFEHIRIFLFPKCEERNCTQKDLRNQKTSVIFCFLFYILQINSHKNIYRNPLLFLQIPPELCTVVYKRR